MKLNAFQKTILLIAAIVVSIILFQCSDGSSHRTSFGEVAAWGMGVVVLAGAVTVAAKDINWQKLKPSVDFGRLVLCASLIVLGGVIVIAIIVSVFTWHQERKAEDASKKSSSSFIPDKSFKLDVSKLPDRAPSKRDPREEE